MQEREIRDGVACFAAEGMRRLSVGREGTWISGGRRGHGSVRVMEHESARVIERGSARVMERGSARVMERGSARVMERGSERVVVRASAVLMACAMMWAGAGLRVNASDHVPQTRVEAFLEQCYENSVQTVFSAAEPFAYIRKSPDIASDYVGKLYKDSAATILERCGDWVKVQSGEVQGYMRKEELVTGSEALNRADQVKVTVARVTADVLNVREGAGMNSAVITQVMAQSGQPVRGAEENGWIPVEVNGRKGYLSADYATLETTFTYAEPKVEEEKTKPADRGKEIADYACGFIGNPYVWGGTSLTEGADCSGFVQSVYRRFGVELPRTTWDMENAGQEVAYEEILPGDIILYDGHVGIYTGEDRIVNAIDEEHGIGITPALFTDVVTIRRIVQ